MKHVIIYGTLGPACRDEDTLKMMFDAGMEGIRLNLSHTRLDESAELIETYHKAAAACGIKPELLVDMQGPELRIGKLEQPLRLHEGDIIGQDCIPFPELILRTLRDRLSPDREAGSGKEQQILLDDGKILLSAFYARHSIAHDTLSDNALSDNGSSGRNGSAAIKFRVLRGGLLESRKSAALPGCSIYTPAMTEDDKDNIRRARAYGVTAVMQPFVRSREDLMEVRSALDQAGCQDIRLFAKIENMEGIHKLDELIPHCDEIVIARGDLGNAMNLWELPAAQKRIAAACRAAGRDFMVVTQMLDSMRHRQVPTRAEVSDIFNAVLDGASSVMVTGETAAGDYPVDVIRYLANTVREAECYI